MVSSQNLRGANKFPHISKIFVILGVSSLILGLGILPVSAHHPFGGQTPSNCWEGFLSGLGHPVIGVDHFIFVIAVGLVAGLLHYGFALPLVFMTAAIAGTGLHLVGVNLPLLELTIAVSVLMVGGLLAFEKVLPWVVMMVLVIVAGIFHGYAYGEAIIGAEMNPLAAYLLGFSVIQGAIAYSAYGVSNYWQRRSDSLQGALNLRFAGFLIAGAGIAFTTGGLIS
jgi:urease accessory protein